MKPIIGELTYVEMSEEEIQRYVRDAERMRAEAVREMFKAMFQAFRGVARRVVHGFRAVVAEPGIHPQTGTR
ncbi:MAG: hypothetical protein WD075_09050 [Rhodospirillales bacterium]